MKERVSNIISYQEKIFFMSQVSVALDQGQTIQL